MYSIILFLSFYQFDEWLCHTKQITNLTDLLEEYILLYLLIEKWFMLINFLLYIKFLFPKRNESIWF